MRNNHLALTIGEFANLHDVNKRTLHYYDEIGLFSPLHKGENGYRYYTPYQSATFEHILSLRELGMSIDEIKHYLKHPNHDAFMQISKMKLDEIDQTIQRLTNLKKILNKKNQMLSLCQQIHHGLIDCCVCPETYLYMSTHTLDTNYFDTTKDSMDPLLEHLKNAWSMSSFKLGCGSFISMEKILAKDVSNYDGLFTEMECSKKGLYRKPKGRYLRGFCIGDWSQLPDLYKAMLLYAQQHKLPLQGFAFERGLNEFAISDAKDYITEVSIFCGVL